MSGSGGGTRRAILALLCTAQLANIMDLSIIQVALPAVQAELGVPTHQLQWVITAYTLTYGGGLLLGGRMGDLFGRRRMLTAGMAIFAAASALGGLATGVGALVAARILKGLAAAVVTPAVMSLLTTSFPEGEARSRALGVLGTASSAGFSLGLILGGILTGTLGWRWVFLGNIPIAVGLTVLAPRLLPESERLRQPVDWSGALAVTAGLALLVYACSSWGATGLASTTLWTLLVAALLLLAVFVYMESRNSFPLVPLQLFRNRMLTGALAATGIFGAIMGPALFMLTLYLQSVLGFDPLQAGFAFLPQEAVVLVLSPLLGRTVARTGTRPVLAGGLLGFGAAVLTLARISADGGYVPTVLSGVMLMGVGVACTIVAGAVAAVEGIPAHLHGLASGLWNTAPQIGSSLGMAALISVANVKAGGALGGDPGTLGLSHAAWLSGFRAAFTAALVFVAVGLWAVLLWMRPSVETPGASTRAGSCPTNAQGIRSVGAGAAGGGGAGCPAPGRHE